MSKDNAWLLKPGETKQLNAKVGQLINEYVNESESYRNMCLNDNNEVVYFISFPDEDSSMDDADVAIDVDGKFEFLPKEIAFQLSKAYVNHITLLADAYEYLERKSG